MFGNGYGKEWEKPYGNPMGMGIGYKIGNGNGRNGIDCTGIGGIGNVKSHSRSSLLKRSYAHPCKIAAVSISCIHYSITSYVMLMLH